MKTQSLGRPDSRISSWLLRVFLADAGRITPVVPRLRDYPVAKLHR
jgi:hypothetical protein